MWIACPVSWTSSASSPRPPSVEALEDRRATRVPGAVVTVVRPPPEGRVRDGDGRAAGPLADIEHDAERVEVRPERRMECRVHERQRIERDARPRGPGRPRPASHHQSQGSIGASPRARAGSTNAARQPSSAVVVQVSMSSAVTPSARAFLSIGERPARHRSTEASRSARYGDPRPPSPSTVRHSGSRARNSAGGGRRPAPRRAVPAPGSASRGVRRRSARPRPCQVAASSRRGARAAVPDRLRPSPRRRGRLGAPRRRAASRPRRRCPARSRSSASPVLGVPGQALGGKRIERLVRRRRRRTAAASSAVAAGSAGTPVARATSSRSRAVARIEVGGLGVARGARARVMRRHRATSPRARRVACVTIRAMELTFLGGARTVTGSRHPRRHRPRPGPHRLRHVPGRTVRVDPQPRPARRRPGDARRGRPHPRPPRPLRPAAAPRRARGSAARSCAPPPPPSSPARAPRLGEAPGGVRRSVDARRDRRDPERAAQRTPQDEVAFDAASSVAAEGAASAGRRPDPEELLRERRPRGVVDLDRPAVQPRTTSTLTLPLLPPSRTASRARGRAGRPRHAARRGAHPGLGDRADAPREPDRRPRHGPRAVGRPRPARDADHARPDPARRGRLSWSASRRTAAGSTRRPTSRSRCWPRSIRDGVRRKGVLLIPSFAIGRTQEIVWELDRLLEAGRIPQLPLYLDSPMAKSASGHLPRPPRGVRRGDGRAAPRRSIRRSTTRASTSSRTSRSRRRSRGPSRRTSSSPRTGCSPAAGRSATRSG